MGTGNDNRFNADWRTDPAATDIGELHQTTALTEQGHRSTINSQMEAHPSTVMSNNQAPPSSPSSSPSQNPFLTHSDSHKNIGNRGMMDNGSSSTYIAGSLGDTHHSSTVDDVLGSHSLFPPSTHEPSPGNPFQDQPPKTENEASFAAFDTWENQPFGHETVPTNAEPHNDNNPMLVTDQGHHDQNLASNNLETPFSSFPENDTSKSQIDTLEPPKQEVDPQMAAESSDDDIDIPISSMPKHAQSGDVAAAVAAAQHSPSSLVSSALGSNEELGTNKGSEIAQNPPVQVMERPEGDSAYVFPSHVFARNTPNAPGEWSTASNESLFSIYMGNMSFTSELMCFNNKSTTEFDKPGGDMFMMLDPPLDPPNASPSQQQQPPLAPAPAPAPVSKFTDISQRTAELHEESARVTEAKAFETMREVIMETSRTAESNAAAKGDGRSSNRQPNRSTQSFAFQTSTDKDRSITSKGAEDKQKQQEVPKAAAVEAPKPSTNAPPKTWLSCFPCCKFC